MDQNYPRIRPNKDWFLTIDIAVCRLGFIDVGDKNG